LDTKSNNNCLKTTTTTTANKTKQNQTNKAKGKSKQNAKILKAHEAAQLRSLQRYLCVRVSLTDAV